ISSFLVSDALGALLVLTIVQFGSILVGHTGFNGKAKLIELRLHSHIINVGLATDLNEILVNLLAAFSVHRDDSHSYSGMLEASSPTIMWVQATGVIIPSM